MIRMSSTRSARRGNTLVEGEITVNQLLLGGSGTIRMNLNANAINPVNQVALVN